jgi:hypothetical protein
MRLNVGDLRYGMTATLMASVSASICTMRAPYYIDFCHESSAVTYLDDRCHILV